MKANNILLAALMTGILMLSPVLVHALTIEPIGDPVPSESWTQQWSITGSPTGFVSVESFVFHLSGDPIDFKSPVVSNISNEGWTGNIVNSGYALMSGPTPAYNMTYDQHYIGIPGSQEFYSDHFVWGENNNFLYGSRYLWTGGGWYQVPEIINPWDYWHCEKRGTVPEPSTLLLLGSGLTIIALWGRKKFKARS